MVPVPVPARYRRPKITGRAETAPDSIGNDNKAIAVNNLASNANPPAPAAAEEAAPPPEGAENNPETAETAATDKKKKEKEHNGSIKEPTMLLTGSPPGDRLHDNNMSRITECYDLERGPLRVMNPDPVTPVTHRSPIKTPKAPVFKPDYAPSVKQAKKEAKGEAKGVNPLGRAQSLVDIPRSGEKRLLPSPEVISRRTLVGTEGRSGQGGSVHTAEGRMHTQRYYTGSQGVSAYAEPPLPVGHYSQYPFQPGYLPYPQFPQFHQYPIFHPLGHDYRGVRVANDGSGQRAGGIPNVNPSVQTPPVPEIVQNPRGSLGNNQQQQQHQQQQTMPNWYSGPFGQAPQPQPAGPMPRAVQYPAYVPFPGPRNPGHLYSAEWNPYIHYRLGQWLRGQQN